MDSNYWQAGCDTIPERVSFIFQSGQWSDCKFLVGSDPNQVAIQAHKMILAMASPVFEAMFYGETAERDSPILVPDIQPVTFKAMLRYMYIDKIEINSFEEAINLYYAAKKYILPEVQRKCVKEVEQYLHICCVCRAYEFAAFYEETTLVNECLKLMTESTNEIINDSSFLEAQLSTVVTICSLKKIDCHELDLFEALERYVKAWEKRLAKDGNNNCGSVEQKMELNVIMVEDENAENYPTKEKETIQAPLISVSKQRPNIRPALEKIRFLVLTAQEFAEGPAKSNLFTEQEILAIFMNIASEKSSVPMPSGFSMSRQER